MYNLNLKQVLQNYDIIALNKYAGLTSTKIIHLFECHNTLCNINQELINSKL